MTAIATCTAILTRQPDLTRPGHPVLTYPLRLRDFKCPHWLVLPGRRFAVAHGVEGHILVLRSRWRGTSDNLLVRAHRADAVERHIGSLKRPL